MQKSLTLLLCTALFCFFNPAISVGQCNSTPCGDVAPQADPSNSCVAFEPNELTCYDGATNTEPTTVSPVWCGSNVNTQWFAFTAITPTTSFAIVNSGCTQGTTLQSAVFSTSDCINFTTISNCINVLPNQSNNVNAVGMVPGQVYYLAVGGSNGAICEYKINPTGWSGFAANCVINSLLGQPYHAYATDAVWSVDPPSAATFTPPVGTTTNVTWLEPGLHNLCVSSTNCALACALVEVAGGFYEEHVDLCAGQSVGCGGNIYSAPGTYVTSEPDGQWCEKTTTCYVHLIPTTQTTETVFMCLNSSATCAGEEFFSPGSYPVTLSGFKGCDSIVTCKVMTYPTSPVTNLTINLCGPAEYQVCGNVYNSSGTYTETCTNWLGCDSIVNLNLAILDPQVVIDPPGTLSCQADTITLNGSNSPPNTALGGTTTYNWFGPGIVGSNNLPTVKVTQPGTYCLEIRHARGAVACRDTACVEVTATSVVPSTPQITGNLTPCFDSTYIYTAVASSIPPPTAFTWTLPGNVSYTTLSLNSIQVTWDTVVPGSVCVTASNICGTSPLACQPVVVEVPVQSPVMTGPATVCAGGGDYLFTLNQEDAGVNYLWTAPMGAVLTGTGDSVWVNFSGAVSGQVCVTPQNACGAGAPVCQNVQVNPVPTADLSGDATICAGDSVALHFDLTGNGPFDVTWLINQQSFTLNDISNGHIVPVSPALTTVYTLVSISDHFSCTNAVADSVTVTVWQPATTAVAVQICAGDSWPAGGGNQTVSGVYPDTLQTIHGCDSVLVTTLTVLPIDTTVIQTSTCDPAQAGTQTQVLLQTNTCDSVIITITTLFPSDTTLIFDTSCDPNNVGIFNQNLTNMYGCDSLVVTTVTFALSDTTLVQSSTCDTALAGVFTAHLLTIDGCDSTIITTVNLLPASTMTLSGTSCNPADVGVFTQILTNYLGCDSTVTTTITLAPLSTTFLTGTTCDPAAAGIFTDTLTTSNGCDSVVVTTVNLLPGSSTSLSGTSCNPAEVGVFTQVLTNYLGCDSTVTTTISLVPLPVTFLTGTTCDPAAAGVFTNTLTTSGGCDSLVTTTVSLLPVSTTALSGTSCNPADVGVFTQVLTNYLGCDSTVTTTITLVPLPTTFLTGTTCDPALAGVFTNTFTTSNGCDSMVTTTVSLLPGSQTALNTTTCDPALAGVFVYNLTNQWGCDSIVTETRTLLPGNTTTIQLSTCDATQVGSTTQIIPNQFGCDSIITTITTLGSADSCSVAATLTGSDIPCGANTGTITLLPTVGTAPFFYTVQQGATIITTGTIAASGSPAVISGLPAGNYSVVLSSSNGQETTTQATITQLVPPGLTSQASSNYTGFGVRCSGATDGSALAIPSGGLAPYTFIWSNGGDSAQINNLAAGIYTVTVIDAHGCTNVSTVALISPAPLEMGFTVNDLDCFGQNDGAIQVDISGGAGQYRFVLNNGPEQSSPLFTGLDPGIYSLTTTDANDCQQTDIIAVNSVTPISVDLGDDINIELGDNATLQATVNVPLDSILSVLWSPMPNDSVECAPSDCLTQTVTPLVSTVYTIKVQALNGCTDEDQLAVVVDRRRHIYVPNVFTPNQESANQLFTIYAKPGAVTRIVSLQVFDRWGDAVSTLTDFPPNSPTIGWDGRFNGRPVNPGVFVWVAELEFIDGLREVFKGDVTVVR